MPQPRLANFDPLNSILEILYPGNHNMPVLFREMIICECGRPAMHNSLACRTCYEDGLRRRWREDFRLAEALAAPVPMQRDRAAAAVANGDFR